MSDSATEFELFQQEPGFDDTDLLESLVRASRNASKPKSPLEDISPPKILQELFDEVTAEPSQTLAEVPQVQPIQQIQTEKQTSPDQAARVLKLSKKYNRPLTMVEDNLPFFEQKEKNEQASQLIQHAPILQTRYQNSLFRALAFDDTEALTWWETGFKDIEEGFQAGLDSRELGLLGHKSLMGDANDVDLERIKELEEKLGTSPERGFLGSSSELIGQIAPGVPDILESAAVGGVTFGTGALIAGQLGPQAALPEEIVTVPGAAIFGATRFAQAELFFQAAKIEAGHEFLELKKIGIEDGNARVIAHGVGLINGVLELVGATAIVKPFGKAAKNKILKAFRGDLVKVLSNPTTGKAIRNAITSYVTVLGSEVGTEFAQEVVSVLAEDLAREIDPTEMEAKLATEEGRAEIAQRLESILIKVSKGMALLAVPGAGVQFHSDFRNAQQAKQTEKAMLDLGENAKNSKLRERLSEEFQAYVEEATKDGPVQDVYIEAKEFVEYFQSKGIDPKEVAQELPSIKDKFDEAVKTNGDLVIPLSEYATKIAGGEHGPELARHSRFRPDDMSPLEAEEWRITQGEKFRAEADRILSENENDQVFQESADRVQEDISNQIQATGKFTKDVADKYGELHGAFAVTMAPKLGVQPHEVYEQFGLQITGKVTPGQGGRTLAQEKRGAFQFPSDDTTGPSLISLFEKADLSTFLHESGHFFFETYRHIGNQSAAPESIRKDMGALLKFVGVKDIETWNSLSFEARRDGHEKVARAFEAFLFEGESPSVELRPLFTRFRAWLVHVYRKLTSLDVVLDDEVREVFGRMLASETKIEEAKHTRLYRPVFENQEQSGLTPEEWTTYEKAVEDSNEEAIAELERKSLGNMRWLSRAKNKLIREKQKEAKAQRFQVEQEVREEISQEPVYRARGFLRRPIVREKEKKKKTDRTLIDPETDSLFAAISKMGGLDRSEIIEQWGVDPKERFKSGVFGKHVVKKDGKSIDEIAERLAEFGYLPVDQNGKVDINQLEELFGEESRGEKQFSDRRPVVDDEEGFLQFEREAGTTIVPDDLPPGKLSIPALEEKYGTEETALWKQLPQGRFGLVAQEGHAPDLVAEVFGFTSGDELVTSLVESPSLVDAVRGRADTIMLERFGDLIEQDQIDNAVNEALHNEARTRFLGIELRALSKRAGGGNVLARAAKDFAQENIGKLRVRDIRPAQYESAAIRAGKKSEQAIIRGNTFEEVNQKRSQVLNHHLTREARLAREKADQYLRYLRKFSLKGTRKNIDPEYVIQIDRLLEQYDLRSGVPRAVNAPQQQETVPLDQFVEEKSELGLAPVVHQSVRRTGDVRPYKEIPFEELQGLRDTIKSIEHTGRSIRTLLLAERKRQLDEAVGEAVEREKATRRLMEIFSVHKSGSDLKTKKFFPAIGQSLSKEGQLAIALNMGNETNISRIQQGYDWSQGQVNQVLSNLDKTDWDFVQSVWDFINEFWPDIEAKENRVTGFAPEKVEATPIQTPFGEYRGGYYPIKYENLLEEKAHSQLIEDEVKHLISGAYTNASTKRGHLQQRVEEVNRKVRLDFGVAFEHVNQVIRDLAFHEYLIDANRIMRHKDFQSAVIGHHGQVVYREMQDMVRDIAVGDIPAQNAFETIIARLRGCFNSGDGLEYQYSLTPVYRYHTVDGKGWS